MKERTPSKRLWGELISEAMAMFIIIVFGDSATCMYTLYDPVPTSRPIGEYVLLGGLQ